MEAAAPPPVSELTYEQARSELVEVVQRLEQGQASLEESLALWERGEALATRCQSWLDAARARLEAASVRTTPNRDSDPGTASEQIPAPVQTAAGAEVSGAHGAPDAAAPPTTPTSRASKETPR